MNKPVSKTESPHLGFISTRLAGMDGVSMETAKWAEVLEGEGYTCFYLAGELDTPPERSYLVEEAHFTHPEILRIREGCFGVQTRKPLVSKKIEQLKNKLKEELYAFIKKFKIELLIPENCLTIPLNIPLGLALTELISETGIPTIAHHHDFYWERQRFLVNAAWDYLNTAFPPNIKSIRHVVINSAADNQLSLRTGISSHIIPNVMDFENPPPPSDDYCMDVPQALALREDELLILQPTRVVQRKGIESAIELVSRLGMKARLVISHASGDEGDAYEKRVREYSSIMKVETLFISDIIKECRGKTPGGKKVYVLFDVYPHADLVTYPSDYEGFGNAFLETLYFRKPIVVNIYSVYSTDIKPRGFETIELKGYVTEETIRKTREVLRDPGLREEMVNHNYELGKRYFSYSVLRQKLTHLLS